MANAKKRRECARTLRRDIDVRAKNTSVNFLYWAPKAWHHLIVSGIHPTGREALIRQRPLWPEP
jgi:hypothetical protein